MTTRVEIPAGVVARGARGGEARIGGLERLFAAVGLFLLTGALLPVLRNGGGIDDVEGDPVMQAAWACLYAGTLLLVIVRRVPLATAFREKWVVALVALALASTAWSAMPSLTLRRAVALLGTTLFGAYLGLRWSPRQLLSLARWVMLAVVLLSLMVALASPGHGIDPTGGWRGAFVHKNALGRAMALAGVVAIGLLVTGRRWRAVNLLVLGLSAALLVLSGSRSSALGLVACAAFVALVRARRWWYAAALAVTCALLLSFVQSGGSGSTGAEQTLEAIGRDATLTGRTELWPVVVEKIGEKPWLGYGYAGFWLGWEGDSADVWAAVRWQPPHAHNGFLDLALDLGMVGCALFLASLLGVLVGGLRLLRAGGGPAAWVLLWLAFVVIANLTESAILARNNIIWALYVATALGLRVGPRSPEWPTRETSDARC